MNVPSLERHEFDLLRGLIETWCGISLEDAKMYLVETRLREVVVETGCSSFGEFYQKARTAGAALRDRIIDDMTTNETSWFRDASFWETVRQVMIPDAVERAKQDGRLRVSVWSAASSTGQEPYTMALLLKDMERKGELHGFRADSFDILATDISRNALAIAEAGRYDPISMRRGLPLSLREQYFLRDGRISVLHDEVRKMVRFKRMNLLDSFGNLGLFDIVLLRNVLIYFAATWKRNILAKTVQVMRSDASLAAGATETLELYSSDFNVVRHGRSTYYRLKETQS